MLLIFRLLWRIKYQKEIAKFLRLLEDDSDCEHIGPNSDGKLFLGLMKCVFLIIFYTWQVFWVLVLGNFILIDVFQYFSF